jgi:hypothetical protein
MIVRLTAGVAIATLAATAVALATGLSASVEIHGPTSIKSGQKFNLTISGHVSTVHRALSTEMLEQTPAGPPCATTLDAEENKSQRPYVHAQGGQFIMHKSFSEVFHYVARSPVPTHRFCAYVSRLIYPHHQLQNQTFAHASLTVTYHP